MIPNLKLFSRLVLRALAFAATSFALLHASAQAPDASSRVTMTTRASLDAAIDTGVLPASQRLSLTLTLAQTPDRAAALDSFLAALTTPSSASFHKWLSPADFASAYGATPMQLAAAGAWAQAQGLSLDSVSAGGTRIVVSGTTAQLQATFATELHAYQFAGTAYYANVAQPTFTSDAAALFTAIQGLDNLPTPAVTFNAAPVSATKLAGLVDANATPILSLDSALLGATLAPSQLAAYESIFRQATAQGITVIASGDFPSTLPEVTSLNTAGTPFAARPNWQAAPGLPADALRHTPDLTTPTLAAFTQAMTAIAAGVRLGNINPVLYQIATEPGLYTQPDAAPAGTWEPATGLGQVDLDKLAKVYPRGVGLSYTSFQASNYSPVHGQGTSFTSVVTSGTGGGTPTGTVSFVTTGGTVLGSAPLINGTATLTLTNLEGGTYVFNAVYSGDATYASSESPQTQIYVQPEPSMLTVAIGGNPTVGRAYTVTVTDTAGSGVGVPTGPITVTLSGTSASYTATLVPAGTSSSSATFTLPATQPGTLTLSITCMASADFSCFSPLTTTVTIAKASPTITISYTPTTPVSGASITLNAAVSTVGTAPAPTGAVTFYDNGTTLNAGQLLDGATTTTGIIPTTSTHNISATYAGDSNYLSVSTTAGSSSNGTINTSLTLTSSSAIVTAGQSITLTASLMPASTGPAIPTGTVTFFDNATVIGTSNLVNGTVATLAVSSLSASTNHTLTAVYSGDGYYAGSTSNLLSLGFSSNGNTTSTVLAFAPANPVHGTKVHVTVAVTGTSGGPIPTGTVTVTNAVTGTLLQGALVNGNFVAGTASLQGGTYSFTASYSGDSTYNPSTSAAVSVVVSPEPVTLAITVPPNATFGSALSVRVDVTGASGLSYPTGSVTLQPQGQGYSASSTAGVTSPGTTSAGAATIIVPAAGAGSVAFTATYTGDKNFASAGPTTVTATIAKAASSVSVAFNPVQPVAGQSTSTSARIAFAGSIAPTGTVQFFTGTTLLGSSPVDATGTAKLATVFAAGNQVVTAVYSGDANYATGTSPATNTTTGTTASTTSLIVSPFNVTLGQATSLNASVGPAVSGVLPTGSVQFLGNGSVLCTATLSGGAAVCSYTAPVVENIQITANYLGDSNFAPSSSTYSTLFVTAPGGSLVATLSPSTAAGGAASTVSALITAPAGTVPTGSIQVAVSGAPGTVLATTLTPLPGTGSSNTASLLIPITVPAAAGTYNVAVSCFNTNFVCTPVNLALISTGATARIATSTALTLSVSTTTAGTSILTATVTPATAGTAALSGNVVFYDGTTQIGSGTITGTAATGVATASVTLSTAATHSLTAVYSGDTVYAGSSSTAIPGTVTASPATITLAASTTTGVAGSSVVLTATVAGSTSAGVGPTGTVSFYLSGTTPRLLGIVNLAQSGSAATTTAILTTSAIPAGAQVVYAVYSGDMNFQTVTSNNITLGFSDYSVTFTPPSLTLNPGKSGQTTLILNLVNGFAGAVSFGCTPPPNASITCTFSPTTLAGGGQTVLTVSTVAPKAQTTQQASLRVVGGVSLAAMLCLLLPAGRRRLPAMLVVLLALALTANLGCSNGTFYGPSGATGGTPLGTVVVMVNTAGSDGLNTIRHDYPFQVTIQ